MLRGAQRIYSLSFIIFGMLSHLTGTILSHDASSVVLDVSGVGYRIFVTPTILGDFLSGAKVSLHTHLSVREDSMTLFGFATERELTFFEMLITVPGIGPKSALAALSLAPIDTLMSAIGSGDIAYLTKVSGIGPKTAKKIVLELQDKISAGSDDAHAARQDDADVVEVLRSLGYPLDEARAAVQKVPTEVMGTSERVKEALKVLGNGN